MSSIESLVARLRPQAQLLSGMRRGLEKESLRIMPDGRLAQTAHPAALGSALTHPQITTDYSEALIELITPPLASIDECLQSINAIHRFVYSHLDDELLWVNSMPCLLGPDDSIPLAQYGSSNSGRMKTLYRMGLGVRYGRRMQTIAGIHYNISFPDVFWQALQELEGNNDSLRDYINKKYFHIIRNFQRYSWLLIYRLGASPAICASFLRGREHGLQERTGHTLFRPEATSLRMSDLGYQNTVQRDLCVPYNDVSGYIAALESAIRTPCEPFEKMGLYREGERIQINGNVLQIENEYYNLIRPKQPVRRNERPTKALAERGVAYVEMRCVDLDPFEPTGISVDTAHFMEVFALTCLLLDSPLQEKEESRVFHVNQEEMVSRGRSPKAQVTVLGKTQTFSQAAMTFLQEMEQAAAVLSEAMQDDAYSHSVQTARAMVQDPALTPSAAVMQALDNEATSFFRFALARAQAVKAHFATLPLSAQDKADFDKQAVDSWSEQQRMEQNNCCTLDQYIEHYFAS